MLRTTAYTQKFGGHKQIVQRKSSPSRTQSKLCTAGNAILNSGRFKSALGFCWHQVMNNDTAETIATINIVHICARSKPLHI